MQLAIFSHSQMENMLWALDPWFVFSFKARVLPARWPDTPRISEYPLHTGVNPTSLYFSGVTPGFLGDPALSIIGAMMLQNEWSLSHQYFQQVNSITVIHPWCRAIPESNGGSLNADRLLGWLPLSHPVCIMVFLCRSAQGMSYSYGAASIDKASDFHTTHLVSPKIADVGFPWILSMKIYIHFLWMKRKLGARLCHHYYSAHLWALLLLWSALLTKGWNCDLILCLGWYKSKNLGYFTHFLFQADPDTFKGDLKGETDLNTTGPERSFGKVGRGSCF